MMKINQQIFIRMKILRILPVAALAFVVVSCQNGSGNGLSENASQTDSLMYYLGQMNAADYLREASRDTIMKSESEKMVYMNGVRAGMASLKDGNDAYNKGFMLGMQMASQMMSFCEQMDVKINRSAYINSLENALMADSMPNINLAQSQFRIVMQNIENAKTEKDKVSSQESLKKVGEAAGLPKINDDLYGKVTVTTDGKALEEGDEVTVDAKFTKEDGESINVPFAPKGKIGNKRNYPEVIATALENMRSGETGDFMTTAHALMGGRAQQMGLKATDVVKFTISATLVPQEEPASETK